MTHAKEEGVVEDGIERVSLDDATALLVTVNRDADQLHFDLRTGARVVCANVLTRDHLMVFMSVFA